MAYMGSIEVPSDRDAVVIEALRCYAAVRRRGEPVLPCMVELGGRSGIGPSAAVALSSVFELTEACLGRELMAGEAGDAALNPDEEAVLALLATAGDLGPHRGSAAVPHGLPGVLVWAVRSACRLCPVRWGGADREEGASACPFLA